MKSLFCSLVRPILQYDAVIWNPPTVSHTQQFERVRKLQKFISFYYHISCTSHDYTPIIFLLGRSSLAERRYATGLQFLNRLLNGKIDSHDLLSLLSFKVPQRSSKFSDTFYLPNVSTYYSANKQLR